MSVDSEGIIFFDGVCNLCNSSVQVIIKNDKKKIFNFASLQSDFAKQFFEKHAFATTSDTIILYFNDRFYQKSSAVLHIAKKMRFPFPMLSIFFIVPTIIRDPIYTYIAKRRYSWFGKSESCSVPTPELKSRFHS